ncbi:MAG TPA: ribosome silencing factor [Thermoanaerobaculia bacterium]|nr:ribosome silencing factor [Thermoanaerobaculia bacterium]
MIEPATNTPNIAVAVQTAVDAILDLKGEDLRVLHLEPVSDFTDYFLVVHGSNSRQVEAIADAIERRLRDQKVRPLHVEGQGQGSWILLDYGDFVVHVFDHEKRGFYALERLWGDAPDVTREFVRPAA